MNITDEQKQQFQEEGYFILENVIPESLLELLRGECGDGPAGHGCPRYQSSQQTVFRFKLFQETAETSRVSIQRLDGGGLSCYFR